jgi:hypothetical protein
MEKVDYCMDYSAISPDRLPKTIEKVNKSFNRLLFKVLYTPIFRGWNSMTI